MEEVDNGPACVCKQDVPKGHSAGECDWPLVRDKDCPVHEIPLKTIHPLGKYQDPMETGE